MIGSHLARALRERGDDVWVLTRRAPRVDHEVQWDPSRGVLQPKLVEGLDGLFNLTGAPIADRPWTRNRRQVLRDSRVAATEALIGSLEGLDRPPKVFVGVSNLGIFGDRGEAWVDDDDSSGSGFLADLCITWEHAHLASEELLGARAAVLRMSVVLSPTGGAFPLMVRPFRYVGGWLGNGRQYTPWISIRDCVAALLWLADQPGCSGGFNGSIPEPTPNKEWLKALGRVMHRPVVTHAPKWALRGALGELADGLFLASIRARPRKLLESGFTFVDSDAEATFQWLIEALEDPPPSS